MTPSLSSHQVKERIRALGEWFHNMDLQGVPTAPDHFLGDYPRVKWRQFLHAVPDDLHGATVLDIGCNGGFYSIEMKRRGADRVVAIDTDDRYLAQARFAAEVSGVELELRRMSVYDVGALNEQFDLVLFMGVLYHLRYPLLALDLLHQHVCRDLLLFQSMQRGSDDVLQIEPDYPFQEEDVFDEASFPKLHFVESKYSSDQTNWWIPNRACVEAMLRSSGFSILSRPEQEVYLCRREETTP